jgi:ABC-type bacteriocin/lantibiotic exporter with double-glycine peptidase domain
MFKKIFKDIFSQKYVIPLLLLAIFVQILSIALPYFGKYFVDYISV